MGNKFWYPVPLKRRLRTVPQPGEWSSLRDYWARTFPYPPDPSEPEQPENYPGERMPTSKLRRMLQEAETYVGYSYTWGGKTPPYFDCSGFVGYLYKEYDLIPESVVSFTGSLYDYFKPYEVDASDRLPGDVMLWGGTITGTSNDSNAHVGFYIGNGYIMDCTGPGVGYRPDNYHPQSRFLGYFRGPDFGVYPEEVI